MTLDGFLSFAHADWSEVAPLRAETAARGIELWHVRRGSARSLAWHDAACDAIKRSRLVVLIVSPAWVRSAPCAYELGLARGIGRPVLAVTELTPTMRVQRLPSVVCAPGIERLDARGSIPRVMDGIAWRLSRHACETGATE